MSHSGHGNEVDPVSTSGTPDEVQLAALSVIIGPQEHILANLDPEKAEQL